MTTEFARRSEMPFGTALTIDAAHSARIARYKGFWDAYLGRHWSVLPEVGQPQLTLNYCSMVVDVGWYYLLSNPPKISRLRPTKKVGEKGEEEEENDNRPVLEFLREVWTLHNDQDCLNQDLAILGGITGDAFMVVSSIDRDREGNMLPKEERRIHLSVHDPSLVFPEFKFRPFGELRSVELWYPWLVNENLFDANGNPNTLVENALDVPLSQAVHVFREVITDNQIREFVDDKEITQETVLYGQRFLGTRENKLGRINVVHFQNMRVPTEYFGRSDLHDMVVLNHEVNKQMSDVAEILAYYACVDEETEILSNRGWVRYTDLAPGDTVLCLDSETDEIIWDSVNAVNVYPAPENLVRWSNRGLDALTTVNHRWLAERKIGRPENKRYSREFIRTAEAGDGELSALEIRAGSRLILGGGQPTQFLDTPILEDEMVELLGWWITEGCVQVSESGTRFSMLCQSDTHNPYYAARIRVLQDYWKSKGHTFSQHQLRSDGVVRWYLGTRLTDLLEELAPNKSIPASLLLSLTKEQAQLFFETLIDGDGSRTASGREYWGQKDLGRLNGFQMLCSMLGKRTRCWRNTQDCGVVDLYRTDTVEILSMTHTATNHVSAPGAKVWCPTVRTGIWCARRNGITYWTGNSPITVVAGARVSDLQRGVNKVWSGLPKDAKVTNLELESDLAGSYQFFNETRLGMLEMARVPEVSTGRHFPSANMSGTALNMLYGPILERAARKRPGYARGFRAVNELILRIAEMKELFTEITATGLKRYHTIIGFTPAIPRNEKEELDVWKAKMEMRISSREQYWRETGEEDTERLEHEIEEEIEEGILPMPTTAGSMQANFSGGSRPPTSSDDTKPPENPKPGTGRPGNGGNI